MITLIPPESPYRLASFMGLTYIVELDRATSRGCPALCYFVLSERTWLQWRPGCCAYLCRRCLAALRRIDPALADTLAP